MHIKNSGRRSIWGTGVLGVFLMAASFTAAQTPSPALLVLEKSDNTLAIVDPANLQTVARVPAGPDPHEIVASPDGKLAYISNYGGSDSTLHGRRCRRSTSGRCAPRMVWRSLAANCISQRRRTKRLGATTP